MSWQDFDKMMDQNLISDVKNTAENNNSSEFSELPLGTYEVAITSMELKESKKGYPMVSTVFKVVAGDYTNRLIFKNSVVYMGDQNDKYRLASELKFLQSLGTRKIISFEGFEAFNKLIREIYDIVDGTGLEYLLEIGEKKGFRNYTIKEIYEPETAVKDDEIPF